MLIGLREDKTPIDFGFNRLKVKVTWVTIVKNVNKVFAHYREKRLSKSFHISHAGLDEDTTPDVFKFKC